MDLDRYPCHFCSYITKANFLSSFQQDSICQEPQVRSSNVTTTNCINTSNLASLSGLLAISANRHVSDSYNVTAEQLFDLFGKFGPIR